jgi:hypothetical protein
MRTVPRQTRAAGSRGRHARQSPRATATITTLPTASLWQAATRFHRAIANLWEQPMPVGCSFKANRLGEDP